MDCGRKRNIYWVAICDMCVCVSFIYINIYIYIYVYMYIYIHMFIYLFVFISIFILSYISLVFQSYLLRCGIPFAWYPFGVQENTEPKNQVFVSASLGLKRLLKYESTPSDVLLVLRINRLFLPLCKVGWIRRSPLVGETTQLTNFGSLRSVPAGHPSTPQKTNIFFLKIDGWKMTFPFKTVPLTFVFCIPPKKKRNNGDCLLDAAAPTPGGRSPSAERHRLLMRVVSHHGGNTGNFRGPVVMREARWRSGLEGFQKSRGEERNP